MNNQLNNENMNKSDSISELLKALVKFNMAIGKVKKDAKNPFFNSTYATLSNLLDVVDPILIENDLALTQLPDGESGLTTIIAHAPSGEWMGATYNMTPTKKDPQGEGSAITYMRRYAIQSILRINIEEDDDANKASTPPTEKKEAYPQNDKPWLTEENFNKIKLRMEAGEKDLYTKTKEVYKMKKTFNEQLFNLSK